MPFVCFARLLALAAFLAAAPAGCRTAYYGVQEALGTHKRDLLVSRVADARDEQEAAKEQFESALDAFSSLVDAPPSDLRATYERLKDELAESEDRAEAVRDRIESIERVSEDLFVEWEKELGEYTSDELRETSRQTLDRARSRCATMITAMKQPEQRMDEVLVSFRDHVLFLKHNLNAQAVASMQGVVETLEIDTARLIADMEAAIAEADEFIADMQTG